MAIYVYVDNSNLFIEGKRVSAVKKGNAKSIKDATLNKKSDSRWRIDFGKLHHHISEDLSDSIAKAMLFGSRPPQNDSVWQMAISSGFSNVIVDRNIANKEKKVDTGVSVAMIKDAFKSLDKENDKIVLVAGDADFLPAIETLQNDGFVIHVYFWGHASSALRNAVKPNFHKLDNYIDDLCFKG